MNKFITVPKDTKSICINTKNVVYFEQNGNKTRVYCLGNFNINTDLKFDVDALFKDFQALVQGLQ